MTTITERPTHPADTNRAVLARIATQEPLPTPTAGWPRLFVGRTDDGKYVVAQAGRYVMARTLQPLSDGRLGGSKTYEPDTFLRICEDAVLAGKFRDDELAEAARVFAENHALRLNDLKTVNDSLLLCLAANHGAALNLLNHQQFIVAPNRNET